MISATTFFKARVIVTGMSFTETVIKVHLTCREEAKKQIAIHYGGCLVRIKRLWTVKPKTVKT